MRFPTLYDAGHKTAVDLVKESGYKEFSSAVTIELIKRYLTEQQNMIEPWIQFSEDIRQSPAWGFWRDNNNKWRVVYSDNGQAIKSFTFDNKADACAKMIKETMEEIMMHGN